MLSRGAPLAFLAGVVLNIVPGVLPFVALRDIAELDYSVPATALTLLGFYVIMFAFIEVPARRVPAPACLTADRPCVYAAPSSVGASAAHAVLVPAVSPCHPALGLDRQLRQDGAGRWPARCVGSWVAGGSR